jgi:uncharacterized membrane protein YkvA (DUF1232 family)
MFRRQVITLWRAFWHPATPFYLKAIMVGVVVYVISPVDLMPDFLVGLGWIDDILLATFAVNWIIKRLPREVFSGQGQEQGNNSYRQEDFSRDDFGGNNFGDDEAGPTINGTSRRR